MRRSPPAVGGPKRWVWAVSLLAGLLLVAMAGLGLDRPPTGAPELGEQIQERLIDPAGPGGPIPAPSSPAGCQTTTVLDEYGLEVPVADCGDDAG